MDPFDLRQWNGFKAAGGDYSRPAMIDQVTIDSRRIDSSRTLFVALPGTNVDGHQFIPNAIKSGAAYILSKKGVMPLQHSERCTVLYVEDPLQAMQAIARCYRDQLNATVIAIAGSYGKTMVKDLLQSIVSKEMPTAASPESFNSQIGVALSLFTISNSDKLALIEAGISKSGEMERLVNLIAPDHAIITNIGKKHLATLGSIEIIAHEIFKIVQGISPERWKLIPHTSVSKNLIQNLSGKVYFWNHPDSQLPDVKALNEKNALQLPYQITFPNGFQYSNVATAGFYYFLDLIKITIKAAWLLGISTDTIKQVLDQYVAEPMRTEIWRSPIGTTFINDTYCSDPQSIIKAFKHLSHAPQTSRKVFVFSGLRGLHNSDTSYRHVGELIKNSDLNLVALIGNNAYQPLVEELKKKDSSIEIKHYRNYQEALYNLKSWVKQDDIVLIKGEKRESLDALTEVFNDSICSNQCWINLAAVEANIATLRSKLPTNTRIMVMVKALAYGTNDIRMGRFLKNCQIDILGVSYVDEAVSLKRAGITQDIFVINAAAYEAAKVVKWGLEVGVSKREFIAALANEAALQQKQIKVHLHIDTGMSRFGCRPEEAVALSQYIQSLPQLKLEGIMTHFACADDPQQDDFTIGQAKRFTETIQQIEKKGISIPWKHAANSGGVMRFDFPQFNMVRVGLAVYGLYPSEAAKKALDLRLALSLSSRIVGINSCQEGESISYGRAYKVQRATQRIAVLPIGYFDGLHRNYSGKGSVFLRGKKAPMVGKICMDFMMVDITDIPEAEIGDPVLIFGEDEHGQYLSPEELAQSGDSIIHELITCLGPRIQRIFVYEEAYQFR